MQSDYQEDALRQFDDILMELLGTKDLLNLPERLEESVETKE